MVIILVIVIVLEFTLGFVLDPRICLFPSCSYITDILAKPKPVSAEPSGFIFGHKYKMQNNTRDK